MKIPHNITDEYTKCEFNPIGNNKDAGFHCLTLVTDFLKNVLGKEIPLEKELGEDINLNNVNRRFHENPQKVFDIIENKLKKYFQEISIKYLQKGDVVIVKRNNVFNFPSIYVGGNKILLATTKGIKVYNLKNYNVVNCYRIV